MTATLTKDEQHETLVGILENLLQCFHLRGRWWCHKTNDGEWVEVSEDLHDHLEEAREFTEAFCNA